ncbi:uncharacterized protein NECHADRAFT_77191 [Fusarium vanettenii 77-13-4]|uniref:Uncharacterized protein n=1 Tax=Fusarium vanettenii (strain ATCC MYA-4622 / CBS 123669 / FGSC 9596 / NRRL 45880 / 77-13-4) TaxID=660122 RepID=C7ZJA7_FUSV7|nr:uncharacterized protein NECHADRAFT_77191 [Fusarium vanettenii 77-13-4]EEU35818.1 predicted protein [Fusarium vanettenii 77-13-4]
MAPKSTKEIVKYFNDSLEKVPSYEFPMKSLQLAQTAKSQLPGDRYNEYFEAACRAAWSLPHERGLFFWAPEAEEIYVQVARAFSHWPEPVGIFRELAHALMQLHLIQNGQ